MNTKPQRPPVTDEDLAKAERIDKLLVEANELARSSPALYTHWLGTSSACGGSQYATEKLQTRAAKERKL